LPLPTPEIRKLTVTLPSESEVQLMLVFLAWAHTLPAVNIAARSVIDKMLFRLRTVKDESLNKRNIEILLRFPLDCGNVRPI